MAVLRLSTVDRFTLDTAEHEQIENLVKRFCSESDGEIDAKYVRRAMEFSIHLPGRLLSFLEGFRREDKTAAVVVTGFPVSDEGIGPTPGHWRERSRATPRDDAYLALLTSRLGDLFCWKSLQDGRLLNDVVPIRGDESKQTGHGSSTGFDVHCEDGYNDFRCDFLGLMCFRNREQVATTVALMDDVQLRDEDKAILSQQRFVLSPDAETVRNAVSLGRTGSQVVALLNGDLRSPYIRIDCRAYMKAVDGDDEAHQAMTSLLGQLRQAQQLVPLGQGDVCLIDNFRCVHGRQPFQAKHDGYDRWYRKALVSRDLRKSRMLRTSAADFVIDMTQYV